MDVDALARRFGTPLYVIDEARLRANARAWSAALSAAWPGPTELLPSLKANTVLALRRILNEEGLGCDCFGHNELALALHAGVPAGAISVNGATKGDDVLELAISCGARLTLDSLDELRRAEAVAARLGLVAVVRLRLRPWLSASDAQSDFSPEPYPAHLAVHDYRAGMPQAEAREAAALAQASTSLDLAGVHAHVSRQTTDLSFWSALGAEMTRLISELGFEPREIDLGGGFAMPRDPTARAYRTDTGPTPTPAEYLRAVTEHLVVERPEAVTLQIEPGRALYGDAGMHLTTVRHIKRQHEPVKRTWIETDTSEAFLADTFIEHNAWTIVGGDGPVEEAAVTGISCGWDVLAPAAPRALPAPGDVLAFLDTGAYQDACASNFNAMGRPATVLVSGDEARVVRRAETFEDLLRREEP